MSRKPRACQDPALRRLVCLQAVFLAVAGWLALLLYHQQPGWLLVVLLLPLLPGLRVEWRLVSQWLLSLLFGAAVTGLLLATLTEYIQAALPLAATAGAAVALLLQRGWRASTTDRR